MTGHAETRVAYQRVLIKNKNNSKGKSLIAILKLRAIVNVFSVLATAVLISNMYFLPSAIEQYPHAIRRLTVLSPRLTAAGSYPPTLQANSPLSVTTAGGMMADYYIAKSISFVRKVLRGTRNILRAQN